MTRPRPPVVGTTTEERLIRDLLAQVKAAGTPRNHLAIKSVTEGEGVCSYRGIWAGGTCTPTCVAWASIVQRAERWIEEQDAGAVVQGRLMEISA